MQPETAEQGGLAFSVISNRCIMRICRVYPICSADPTINQLASQHKLHGSGIHENPTLLLKRMCRVSLRLHLFADVVTGGREQLAENGHSSTVNNYPCVLRSP